MKYVHVGICLGLLSFAQAQNRDPLESFKIFCQPKTETKNCSLKKSDIDQWINIPLKRIQRNLNVLNLQMYDFEKTILSHNCAKFGTSQGQKKIQLWSSKIIGYSDAINHTQDLLGQLFRLMYSLNEQLHLELSADILDKHEDLWQSYKDGLDYTREKKTELLSSCELSEEACELNDYVKAHFQSSRDLKNSMVFWQKIYDQSNASIPKHNLLNQVLGECIAQYTEAQKN